MPGESTLPASAGASRCDGAPRRVHVPIRHPAYIAFNSLSAARSYVAALDQYDAELERETITARLTAEFARHDMVVLDSWSVSRCVRNAPVGS